MVVRLAETDALALRTSDRIDALRMLEPDWDGYGALPLREDVLESAKTLMADLPADAVFPPEVMPVSNGCLQLEWHRGGRSLELEFESADAIRYLKWEPSEGVEEEGTVAANGIAEIVELIGWFLSEAAPC